MKVSNEINNLIDRFLKHDKTALARIISLVENDPEAARTILGQLNPYSNDCYIIGITGSPGTGKSTLVTQLSQYLTELGLKIGIISVDPSSPLGGGAFLGDRVRMRDIILNPNVFIRSVASRGSLGGLAKSVFDIARLYDAYGMDYVLIETVGAGQSEIDIFSLAYTIIMITVPGLGDHVQVLKAGILEIADIFVINKSDLGGDFLKINLNMVLQSDPQVSEWRVPIIRTIATEGQGISDLFEVIQEHQAYLTSSGLLTKKKRFILHNRIQSLIETTLFSILSKKLLSSKAIDNIVEQILSGSIDIYNGVFQLLNPLLKKIENLDL